MPFTSPEIWRPVGVESLESAAELVVRSNSNMLVTAGPGAGKTELLAQRASYLLDTGTCPSPRRILAISFKRDAAKNLGDRVTKRCGARSERFDSLTLDAFAKGLIDRFRLALPDEWRPPQNYELLLKARPIQETRNWLASVSAVDDRQAIDVARYTDSQISRLFDLICHGYPLPYNAVGVPLEHIYLGRCWWSEQLGRNHSNQSCLTFPMLNRLAAFLLRQNPRLTSALRMTYAHVFLDEFQDTTAAQYDLIQAAFRESGAILTAVGDSKQRIMLWAGALAEVFNTYEVDFGAQRQQLVRNYRSAPELVAMQQIIAQALESGVPPVHAAKTNATGVCAILEFSDAQSEANYIADMIARDINAKEKKPRDFCILARQRTDEMIGLLKTALARQGIQVRDESQLQDLLAEPVVQIILAVLRLATRKRDAEAWNFLLGGTASVLGLDIIEDLPAIEREMNRLVQHARDESAYGRHIAELPSELLALLGKDNFRSAYRQYSDDTYLSNTVEKLSNALRSPPGIHLAAQQAVDDLIGDHIVPAMTIHKSKGLEFQTVVFLGLEDNQWWGFANAPDEEKRSFFVAFSRAIERVYFTYSDVRMGRYGPMRQQKVQIGDLYNILKEAGVLTTDCRNS